MIADESGGGYQPELVLRVLFRLLLRLVVFWRGTRNIVGERALGLPHEPTDAVGVAKISFNPK